MAKRKVFTVNRKKWLRGELDVITVLLDSYGSRCCLGFVMKQLGYSDRSMLDVHTPMTVLNREERSKKKDSKKNRRLLCEQKDGLYKDSLLAQEAIDINDDVFLSEEERESALIELFDSHGCTIQFED